MENPSRTARHGSILDLIADGREVRERLAPVMAAQGKERETLLQTAVRPYLQLVEAEEKDARTGIALGDVWRYFRYTWSIPSLNIPGRQLFYLVRDAAHPFHAVMGIAALSNASMQMKVRDDFIGWTADSFVKRATEALKSADPQAALEKMMMLLESNLSAALEDIAAEGLATAEEIESPTPALVARLKRRSLEFADKRAEALEEIHSHAQGQSLIIQETEPNPYDDLPPVAEDVLQLEMKFHAMERFRKPREMMVRKKRAFELHRLLQSRLRLREVRGQFLDPVQTLDILLKDETRSAVTTAMLGNKSRRVGTNMLELTTCGAIPPCNHLLGGKLAALLMLSPQVAADYRRRYGGGFSIISSLLKNERLVRDSSLVWLGTTSLYALGSSQYERLRLPAGIIAPDQPELRFHKAGFTSGYGTVQFSSQTVKAVEKVVEQDAGYRDVNSMFGEGPSPLLRKLRNGLNLLGFSPEHLMKHNQRRLIYAMPLAVESAACLRGESVALPSYITEPEQFPDATERIADFWRARWLASRLNHLPAMTELAAARPWRPSDQLGEV